MDCSTPGLPVHRQLLEFTQIHVHDCRSHQKAPRLKKKKKKAFSSLLPLNPKWEVPDSRSLSSILITGTYTRRQGRQLLNVLVGQHQKDSFAPPNSCPDSLALFNIPIISHSCGSRHWRYSKNSSGISLEEHDNSQLSASFPKGPERMLQGRGCFWNTERLRAPVTDNLGIQSWWHGRDWNRGEDAKTSGVSRPA